MSYFLVVGPENAETELLKLALPGPTVLLESLAGDRASSLLANGCTVILSFPESFFCARIARAIFQARLNVRVFAVSWGWSEEEQEEVLSWGVRACLALPLQPEVVRKIMEPQGDTSGSAWCWDGAIQYRHGYPGRHLGSLDQPGF